tara:strand:+ start:99090 stop:100943 length:1854 start_codon:yes stop_codon:yes gene_type:complete
MKKIFNTFCWKKWCTGILVLFLVTPIYCGSIKEDSLLQVLGYQKDTTRINTLNKLAWYYNSIKNAKAESMGLTALDESLEINFSQGALDAHRRLADFYRNSSLYSQAQKHLFEALKYAEKTNNRSELFKTYVGLGSVYFYIDNTKKSLEYYLKAYDLSLEMSNNKYTAIICNNLGQVAETSTHYNKAISYYRLGLLKENPKQFTDNYVNLIQNMGSAFYYLNQTDSAFYYNNLAKSLYIQQDNLDGLLGCYINEGVFIEESHDYAKAIESYQKGLQLITAATDLTTIQNFNQNIMLCYGYLGNIDSINHYFDINNKLEQQLIQLKTDQAIHDVSIKYDVEKKEQALLLAEQKNEKAALSNQLKQRTIYILLAVIAIISLIVVIFYLLIREKQKLIEMEVKSKNNEIEKLIKDQEIKTYKAQLNGIEKERQRVAQDLHDRIGGLLATVKLQFEGGSEITPDTIENVKSLVNESIQTVRSISHDLSDGRVDQMGLIQSIENLKESFSNSSKVSFDLYLDNYQNNCPIEKEREIFKIILELLSNTLKHADASHIVLQINTLEQSIQFTFEDNGIGFIPTKVKNGLGMRTISKRVDKLNGTWYIDSKKGHGSTIVIEIPIS